MITRAVLSAILVFAAAGFGDERVEKLTPEHRKWLEEEVVYIITDQERDVFLSLPTVEDRLLFIQAFWDRRDPDPATPENELQAEHYERLDYANRIFARDAPRPGWKTDMGKFWIILGKPQDIQRYDGLNEVVTTQVWFYSGDTNMGQPPRFNLVFFKEQDVGEYKLYSPAGDGPEALLRAGSGPWFRTNQHLAVDVLEVVSMDLARASLTVDLTEPVGAFLSARNTRAPITPLVRVPMNVENVLVDIERSALRRVDTRYLDGYLKYKDKVTADYSFRFVPGRQYHAVLFGPEATPFVHYAVELDPEHFSLQADEERTRFYTTLDVSVEARDPDGNLVAVWESSPYLELSGSQMAAVSGLPFAYHDDFPLLPGDYSLNLILKNRATKQFTAGETRLRIDPPPEGPGLGGLVVGYKTEISQASGAGEQHRAFQVGGEIVYPAIDLTFTPNDTAYVFAQLWNALPEHRLRISISGDTGSLPPRELPVGSSGSSAAIEEFSLSALPAGTFRVRAELLDPSGKTVAERASELHVSPRSSIARAGFVFRRSFNPESPGLLALARGQQHLSRGQLGEAEEAFRRAVEAGGPKLPMARWKLATVLLYSAKADEVLDLLLPLAPDHPNEPEVVEGLGLAYYLKRDYASAVPYLEQAIALRPPEYTLLNALGDTYQTLGRSAEAKEIFERSLALNPQQESVKSRLQSLDKSP